MKAAILISRTPEYRLFAPIIEAALARGCEVECWHDYGQARTGPKAYQFPSVDSVPDFVHGRPCVRNFQGPSQLKAWLAELQADVVISMEAPEDAAGSPLPEPRPLWVRLQFLFESFLKGGADKVATCDRLALHSPWWLEWAGEYLESEGLVDDRKVFLREAGCRAAFVGLPELDAVRLIDPAEVRRRWGIPPTQPVVVLLPFPQGVGWAAFWPRQIFAEPNRWRQLSNIAARGRFEYLPHVWHDWNDRHVLRALRRFCDSNGAYLLIKSRLKTPVPGYAQAIADKCLYDERYYPATILEALSIASLSVSYYSNTVFESVALGVPHLCLAYRVRDYLGQDPGYLSQYYSPDEGSPFQFRGASRAWSIPEALSQFPAATLGDFAIDGEARRRYVEKFLTHDAGDGGVRTMDAIEQTLNRPSQCAASPS